MHYDIILIHTFHRRHFYYLHFAAAMGKRFRIAFIDSGRNKVPGVRTDKIFLEKLKDLGVVELPRGEKASADLLIIPNYEYPEGFLDAIKRDVTYRKAVAVSASLTENEWFESLRGFGVNTIFHYAPHRFLYDLEARGQAKWKDVFRVLPIGDIYHRHPPFKIPSADYIIAYPSHVGLSVYSNRRFLRNILKLLDQIKGQKIYLKTHNVRDIGNDYYDNSRVERLRRLPAAALWCVVSFFSAFLALLDVLRVPRTRAFYDRFVYYEMHALNALIAKRSIRLDAVTPYFNFAIELFFPFIQKGVITGKSMTMFFALLENLPVYMCDDAPDVGSGKVFDDIRFWGVAPCAGRLEFDPKNLERIPAECRDFDIVQWLEKELSHGVTDDRRTCGGKEEQPALS
jgi:hypothetical protein